MSTPDPYGRWSWWMVATFLAGLAYASVVGSVRRLLRAAGVRNLYRETDTLKRQPIHREGGR